MTVSAAALPLRRHLPLLLALIGYLVLVAMAWVGFLGSDDVTFALGAYGWLEHFPFVGGHGTIRYTITIPMAVAFRAVGENELAMALPGLLYIMGMLAIVWRTVRDVAGSVSAACALVALITSPLLVVQGSIANVDMVEMFFLMTSVLLYYRCVETGPRPALLLGAGALAGLAFLTRETAVFIIPFYGIVFASGYAFARKHYLLIAVGFLAVWGLELLYLWSMTGDPLFRVHIALHHDPSISRDIDLAGNMIVHPLIDPLLVLLINQEFMALFFLAIPLGIWLACSSGTPPRVRRFSRILGLFGLVWFVCAGSAQHLLPLNPRYFMITAAVAAILTGLAIGRLLHADRRAMAGASVVAALLIVTNFVGIYVENKVPTFGEHVLANVVAERPGVAVYTDPMTAYRADMLLRWERARDRVMARPPVNESLFFYDPQHAKAANRKTPADLVPQFRPRSNWRVEGRWEPSPGWLAVSLEKSGLARVLPPAVWYKLRYRHPPVTLYRLP